MVAIPQNKRRSVERVKKKRIVLFGEPGVGKTYFANTIPDILFLNTDGNDRFYDAPSMSIPKVAAEEGKTCWEVSKELVDLLSTDNSQGYNAICVDLLNHVYEYARMDFLNEQEWVHEDDAGGFGKGYKLIADSFKPVFDKLNSSEYEWIIYNVHEKTSTITNRLGAKYDVIGPKLTKGLTDEIASKVDFIGRVYVDENGNRWIRLQPSADMGTFTRHATPKEIPATLEAVNALFDDKMVTVEKQVTEALATPTVEAETVETEAPKRKMKRKDDGE